MNDATHQQALLKRLRLPEANLKSLSFCKSPTPRHVQHWVESLPLTRISFVSAVLYSALPEFARLKTDGETHMALLELVRPAVQDCITALARSFLNQPLILPANALKAATIAQALQKHLSNAYLGAVRDTIESKSADATTALAIHRAITGFGLILLRSYQLYTPTLNQLWVELHALYRLAELQGIADLPVTDPLPGHEQVRTVTQAYLRVVLLAAARPNQLRQQDQSDIYNALETLTGDARITPLVQGASDNLHIVMLDSDVPPVYRSRLKLFDCHDVREINIQGVLGKLGGHKTPAKSSEAGLSPALVAHLEDAWGKPAQRIFERQAGQGELEITIGLTNVHFHSADGVPFNLFLQQPADIGLDNSGGGIFKQHGLRLKGDDHKSDDDPWGEAYDVARPGLHGSSGHSTANIEENIRRSALARYRGQHPILTLGIIDTSASGYGLELREQGDVALKSGDILGVREPGRRKWAIAAVRWVQRSKESTQLGIQLLAPQALPAAAAIVQKTGNFAEYLRALELPALRMAGQPETLITNAVGFHEQQKIKLYRDGKARTVQLVRRIFTTGSISQFAFRELAISSGEKPKEEPERAAFDFNSIWKTTE